MKYLKSHILLIFALVSILFSIESYWVINKIVDKYETKIVKNYTILVVSKTKIDKININEISKIEQINIDKNLQNLKKFNNLDLDSIKKSLPYFYKLYFKKFPTPNELKQIETKLLANPNIKRVESFRIKQHQIYNLLSIIKIIITIFMSVVLFISTLLIVKQLEVWKLEHNERMYIMELFGAPFGLKSAILLKIAFTDAFISIALMAGIIEYIFNSSVYLHLINQLQINIEISFFRDMLILSSISFSIAIVSTIIVILSRKKEI